MLLGGKSEASAYSRCTVTLSKPDTVITARHCVSHTHGDTFWVYFPFGGVRRVSTPGIEFFCHDGDTSCSVSTDDLAIAKLETPYTFLSPAASGAEDSAVTGQNTTIVGYGLSHSLLADYGVKREGSVRLDTCNLFPADGLSLCYQYEELTVAGENGEVGMHAACNNDSGGPMLTTSENSKKMIGVASQTAGSCGDSGEGRYVNLTNLRYLAWLNSGYCYPACSIDPNVKLTTLVDIPIARLDESESTHIYDLNIPAGTATVIVTLNHERGWFPSPNNLNVSLPSALNPNCVQFIEVEVCEGNLPPAGVHQAIVTKVNGEAWYQFTAVAVEPNAKPDIE